MAKEAVAKMTSGYITAGLVIPVIIVLAWILFYVGLDGRQMSTTHFGVMGQMATSWIVLALAGSSVLPQSSNSIVLLRLFWLIYGIVLLLVSFQGLFRDSSAESECIDYINDGGETESSQRCGNVGCGA